MGSALELSAGRLPNAIPAYQVPARASPTRTPLVVRQSFDSIGINSKLGSFRHVLAAPQNGDFWNWMAVPGCCSLKPAPQERQTLAHGASRGNTRENDSAPEGRKMLWPNLFRPLRGSPCSSTDPLSPYWASYQSEQYCP